MTHSWSFLGWYYDRAGQRTGPVATEEMVALLKEGGLAVTDPVWRAWQESDGGAWFFQSRAGQLLGLSPQALGVWADPPPCRVPAG